MKKKINRTTKIKRDGTLDARASNGDNMRKHVEKMKLEPISQEQAQENKIKATPDEVMQMKIDLKETAKLGRETLNTLKYKLLREKRPNGTFDNGETSYTHRKKNIDDVQIDDLRDFADIYSKVAAKVIDANRVLAGFKDKDDKKADKDDVDFSKWLSGDKDEGSKLKGN